MKKQYLYLASFILILLFVIFYRSPDDKKLDQNEISEADLFHLDSIAFSSRFSPRSKDIENMRSGLFFPIEKGVKTYFLDETIADSLFCKSFIGHSSGTLVYFEDIYQAKSQKLRFLRDFVVKKIQAREVATDPRATIRWINALGNIKNKTMSLKDFITETCFSDEKNRDTPYKIFPEEKEKFTKDLIKKILSEEGQTEKEKLLNFSRKIAFMNQKLSKLWRNLNL